MAPKRRPVPLNITPIGEGQATSNTIDAASEWVTLVWVHIECVNERMSIIALCVWLNYHHLQASPMHHPQLYIIAKYSCLIISLFLCVSVLNPAELTVSPSQSKPWGLTEETGWAGPGRTAEETTGSLSYPESSGWGAEGWGFWPHMWVGCWKRRSGQQGPPQTLEFGHGSEGEN